MVEAQGQAVNVWAIAVPLVALILVVITHIFIMARWSGKVDANLTQIMAQPAQSRQEMATMAGQVQNDLAAMRSEANVRLSALEVEIKSLRVERHDVGNKVAVHEGQLSEMRHRLDLYSPSGKL